MTVNDLVCLERVGAWLRAKLAEPGMLRGRQRGEEYVDRVIRFALYVVRVHGRDDHEHIFPLSRMPMSGLASLGMPEWSIRSFIGVLERAGFVEPQGPLVRRCHAGTVSPTDGAKAVWWCPRQFKLSQAIRSLFGKSPDPDLDASPLGSQSAQDETPNLSEYREGQNERDESLESTLLGGLTGLDDDPIVDELEESLDTYRRTVVPQAMPDRRRHPQKWEPTFEEMEQIWLERARKGFTLSAEALKPKRPW
ncbi:hypothetical protein LNAOJCKE_0377 [Methylorubrum aminovorans]|uniref:Uncharacterized protein n=1 Tax=Methylorubrum aminovorans TaxID=269069 RepID=A0ABQ4U832_9HYPH|nr:hypothetical protein [Methylorubrum aminovorans]GJE63183.1 hypothetical protein LNAOJCKE_0377 [Methylorubrum aminovorans]